MKTDIAAKAFKELGHPLRLDIFKRLVKAGYQGMPVGRIQDDLGIPGSTLSHHIAALVSADLISQRKEGRSYFCVAEIDKMREIIDFLLAECCADQQAADQ